VFVLAGNRQKDIRTEAARLTGEFRPFGTLDWEPGSLHKGADGRLRDHFGFVEGISQPVFFARDMASVAAGRRWNPAAALSYVLSPQPGAENGEYGSFMAFLKIAQDTSAFDEVVRTMVRATGATEQNVRSWMLGRTDDGEPLVPRGVDNNDFDYSDAAALAACPAAAHVRKVNPRSELVRRHRILRRSALYGQSRQARNRGTLFQCFQSKLETGFEFIFERWALQDNHPEKHCGVDALLGARDFPPCPSNTHMNPLVPVPFAIRPFTTIKFGEYFHFPSIPFLRARIV
jgi:Dyp-type peroxidase family